MIDSINVLLYSWDDHDHSRLQLALLSYEIPIQGIILPAVMQMPWDYKALRTSLVDSNVSFLLRLTSPIYFIYSSVLLRTKSAICPRRLKKLSSLHQSPVFSHILFTKHQGMILLVFDDQIKMEWIIRSNSISSLLEYQKSGAESTCSFTCYYQSSQFQSIRWQIHQKYYITQIMSNGVM